MYWPLLTTWICAVDEDDELSEFELAPSPPELPLPRLDDDWPEPLPEPVGVVPPLPLLESCSPTVRSTLATVPSNVATSDAPASACRRG